MPQMRDISQLIDKIRTSATANKMTNYSIRLMVEYGDFLDIIPTYDKDLRISYEVFRHGEKYNNIFCITESSSSIYGKEEWGNKNIFLATSGHRGSYSISQLEVIEKKSRGIHSYKDENLYKLFNKMDTLFCLCDYKFKGLDIVKDPKKTSIDNLIIEIKYPDYTPKGRVDSCTELIEQYGYLLKFVPFDEPNQKVNRGVDVYNEKDKQHLFTVGEINNGFVINYSETNSQIVNNSRNCDAIPMFKTLLDLCESKVKRKVR